MRAKQPINHHLLCFVFLLAGPPAFASIGLGLFILGAFYNYFRLKPVIKWRLGWPFIILYGIYIVGFLYSPDRAYALHVLGKTSAFLVIPMGFIINGPITYYMLKQILRFFIIGVIIWNFVSLLIAGFIFFETNDLTVFTYYDLAEILHLHPTYQSLYILTALIFLRWVQFPRTFQRYVVFLFLVFVLLLLESRITVLFGIFIIGFNLIKFYKTNKALTFLTFVIILFAAFLFLNLSKRMDDIQSSDYKKNEVGTINENGINQRIWLWKNAWEQYLDKPLFGYGLGSQKTNFSQTIHKNLLFESYDRQYSNAAQNLSKLNLHNQYFQILYEFGLLGLSIFLGILVYILECLYEKKMLGGMAFILIFCVVLLTENLLDRQMGIYLFMFFSSLLIFAPIEDPIFADINIPTAKV